MRIKGKIIKGIAGFYYIHVQNEGIFECKARGIFRKKGIKPLIGDNVTIDVIDSDKMLGNIMAIEERQNELIRPTVANIGQVIIVFAANNPKPNLNLLDRFIIMIERAGIDIIICFNKIDQVDDEDEFAQIKSIYEKTGYPVFLTSAKQNIGIEDLMEKLGHTTSAFAGPSGVGKSSLLNIIQSEVELETGEISDKIKRGKHTTRHAELICFRKDSYVVDTPGFSSIDIDDLDKDDLKYYFIEFDEYENTCKFNGCNHLSEPECSVKSALEEGKIAQSRYDNYHVIYDELKNIRRKW